MPAGRFSHRVLVIPEPLRRPAAVLASLSAVAFIALSIQYAGDTGYGRLDSAAIELAQDHLWELRRVFTGITRFGSPGSVLIMSVVLTVGCLVLRRYRLAALALSGPVLTGAATILLKPIVGRVRGDDLAFPSGHAAGLIALVLVAALIAIGFAASRLRLVGTLAALGVLVAGTIIGIAVMARGGHYLTDTVGSFCLAVALVLWLGLLIDRLPSTFRTGDAPVPDQPASASR